MISDLLHLAKYFEICELDLAIFSGYQLNFLFQNPEQNLINLEVKII